MTETNTFQALKPTELTGVVWRTSSRSNNNGGNCVEVGAWRKSSRTNASGANCVETALIDARVAVRDSKYPQAGILELSPSSWAGLLNSVHSGDLDG